MNHSRDLIGKTILGYRVIEQIGSGGFGTVYKVSKTNESGEYTYALKHITLPTETQYNYVLSSMGGDYEKADHYFKNVLSDIVYEINILSSLSEKNSNNVVTYYDNEIVKQDNPIRYDIYIRMEYLTPLATYVRNNEMRVNDIIDLGIDILSALDLCHSNHIIHRDIKDDNIFVNKDGKCKLGDFGIAKVLKDTSKAASMKGTPAFIAPEVFLGQEKYSNVVDLYSLGIVLYKIMNDSRLPFLPAYPKDYEMDDVDHAIGRRLAGEIPDLPTNARNEFGEILVKAISSKEQRYQHAKDFADALKDMKNHLSNDYLERVINKNMVEAASNRKTMSSTMGGLSDRTVGVDFARDAREFSHTLKISPDELEGVVNKYVTEKRYQNNTINEQTMKQPDTILNSESQNKVIIEQQPPTNRTYNNLLSVTDASKPEFNGIRDILAEEVSVPTEALRQASRNHNNSVVGLTSKNIIIGGLYPGAGSTFVAMCLARALNYLSIENAFVESPINVPELYHLLYGDKNAPQPVKDPFNRDAFISYRFVTDEIIEDYAVTNNSLKWTDGSTIWYPVNPKGLEKEWTYHHGLRLLQFVKSPITIFDVSNHWNHEYVRNACNDANEIIFVCDTMPSKYARRDTADNIQLLNEWRRKGKSVHVVGNRDVPSSSEGKIEWLESMPLAPTFLVPNIPHVQVIEAQWNSGIVQDDASIKEILLSACLPFLKVILPETMPIGAPVAKKGGFLSRLFS
ncbi:serine/threonine-protein kinase [Paenibacillus sp. FSL H8-0034]|uniref:serine/threonine-protein kinase n=1 Tax=Paenibacillus sp. FSL H8-0034 TaxID=2954671 RepID=UPI0030F66323